MAGNGMRESVDGLVQGRGERFDCQPLEGLDQRMCEAMQPVAVAHDGFAFHLIQHFPNLLGAVLVVIQERDKAGNGALEVNVIFPKRIVGVDEKTLSAI